MPLPTSETLTIEFKSDRNCLSDRDLIEAIVCLANTEGGTLYLGVEDDGTITGLHKKHRRRRQTWCSCRESHNTAGQRTD